MVRTRQQPSRRADHAPRRTTPRGQARPARPLRRSEGAPHCPRYGFGGFWWCNNFGLGHTRFSAFRAAARTYEIYGDAVTEPIALESDGRDAYQISRPAFDVFVYTLEWSISEFDEPGLIPRGLIETLKRRAVGRPNPDDDIAELVDVGLWERVDEDGFRVIDQWLVDRGVQRTARKSKASEIVSQYRPIVSIRDSTRANPENNYPEFNFMLDGPPLSKAEYDSIIAQFSANQIRAGIDSKVEPQ